MRKQDSKMFWQATFIYVFIYFIQQGYLTLIKRDSRDIFNVTQKKCKKKIWNAIELFFLLNFFEMLLNFLFFKESWKQYYSFHEKMK